MVKTRNFSATQLVSKNRLTKENKFTACCKKKRLTAFSLLSGEVHKESFVDVFNTTFEQVAFSLSTNKSVNSASAFTNQAKPLTKAGQRGKKRQLRTVNHHLKTALGDLGAFGFKCYHDYQKLEPLRSGTRFRFTKRGLSKPNLSVFISKQIKTWPGTNKAGFLFSNGMNRQVKLCKKARNAFVEKKKTALRIKIGDYVSRGDKAYKSVPASRLENKIFAKTVKTRCKSNTIVKHASFRTNQKCKNLYKQPFKRVLPLVSATSGKIIRISKTQITFQKVQSVLFYSNANLHVRHGDWIKRGSPILTLTHQTLITGDIVQGIPKIEQLFEAFTSPPVGLKDTNDLHNTLHTQLRDIFRKAWLKNVLPIAVRQSLEEIQQILVESIQKVYLSQGVLIADKHIEIIVRQMTSKVEILDAGSTGLLLEEIVNVKQIENANLTTPGKKALYVPAIVGLTQAALSSDSFISAASFQETVRVLSRDAVIGKSDFLRGLKEKVVIGDLISAGTGLEIYFVYNLLPEKLNLNQTRACIAT